MAITLLRPTASPLYAFLSFAASQLDEKETLQGKRFLDCGAGGPVPSLALFRQHGLDASGIDSSPEQLALAHTFAEEHGTDLDLRQGDMREIPFDDATFDYVYEHYSMCHLSKLDTQQAVNEMRRVLRAGGLCFLGVISHSTWPKSIFRVMRQPGEYWMHEQDEGDELTLHSIWGDEDADALVGAWDVLGKEKRVQYLLEIAEATSVEEWMMLHPHAPTGDSVDGRRSRYPCRTHFFQYAHLYYYLRKPRETTLC